MHILIVFNTVVNLIVVCNFLSKKLKKFRVRMLTTFFQNKPYGFSVYRMYYHGLWEGMRTIFSASLVPEKYLSDEPYKERNTSWMASIKEGYGNWLRNEFYNLVRIK